MTKRDTEVRTALMLQRVFVGPSNDETTNECIQEMVIPIIKHVDGKDNYRPIQLQELGDECEIVLYAESGIAKIDRPDDSLKAVYVARGFFQKTVENMDHHRSWGTIDFEGTLQIRFLIEQIVGQIDERTGLPTVIKNSPPTEPELVNRIDGEQSDLFSRIEQILVFCPSQPDAVSDNRGQLQFEKLVRVNVTTRSEMEPTRYQDYDIESAVVLGEGVLIWPSRERHTDRYGFIQLVRKPEPGIAHVSLDIDGVLGKAGSLVCQIVETRVSPMEDHFRGLVAQTPEIGEIIELGKGTLLEGDDNACGIEPGDGRKIDWLNPRALYRVHLQTVRLLFLPSESRDN